MRLFFCVVCGAADELEHHHIIAQSEGGTDDEANLLTLCPPCHGVVHGMKRRHNIRELTIQGLQKAKARGVKLGNPDGAKGLRRWLAENDPNRRIAAAAVKKAAEKRAEKYRNVISEMALAGDTQQSMAKQMNERGLLTARNCKWTATSISNLLKRLGLKEQ